MKNNELKPIGFFLTLIYFGIPSFLLVIATHIGIPFLKDNFNLPQIYGWFLTGGLVMGGLFFASLFLIKKEGFSFNLNNIKKRLRLLKVSKKDFLWAAAGLILTGVLSALLLLAWNYIAKNTGYFSPLDTQPAFFGEQKDFVGQPVVLLFWFPYWFFNIAGEELFWRGYILPRQELAYGNKAWILNGLGWMLFHVAFGLDMLIMIIPIILIQPFVVQKRKNTWLGIFIHGLFNGPAFVLIVLGLIH